MDALNSCRVLLRRIKSETTNIHIILFALLVLALVANGPFASLVNASDKSNSVLGGPEVLGEEGDIENQETMLIAAATLRDISEGMENLNIFEEDEISIVYLIKGASLSNNGAVLGGSLTKQSGDILTYRVQEGDNLSSIASRFGISVNTLLWANNTTKNKPIQPGEELTILPVSGVLYKVKSGDTLASISASFGVSAEEIAEVNNIINQGAIIPDAQLVIPNGQPLRSLASLASASRSNLPSLPGFFIFPLPKNSWNWGRLHKNNAVDIANVCGTPIYAAAAGIVVKIGSPDNWNGGYGGYIVLEHQNGTETLYGHVQEVLVDVGNLVEQKTTIAKVGTTGNSTGCHVHFEIHGARNPFVK